MALPQDNVAGGLHGRHRSEVIRSMPVSLRHRKQALESLWQQGMSGRQLLQKHTELIDEHLQQWFNGCRDAGSGFALVALGGYGRSELFPYSDIDLLLLYAPEVEASVNIVAEAILYPLWDAGLEVGHGVRTPAACLADARDDFFFQVALLDARLIAGAEILFQQLQESFALTFIEGRRKEFLATMIENRSNRHQRFGQHSYMLEPQIKECRGGLRDVQALLWTAKAVFGLNGTDALQDAGLLTAEEKNRFDAAWNQLIRVRNRLHYLCGRKNDQLFFEHQVEMARAFSYKDADEILAVEHFMRDIYSCLQTIAVSTDLFFEHVDEVLGLTTPATEIRQLEPGIELRQGRIRLTGSGQVAKSHLIMRVFALSARTGAPIHYRTKKIIAASLQTLAEHRSSRRLAKSFLEILQADSENLLTVLEALLETGAMAAVIPEFAKVVSLAQHDVYHVYTVDIHLLHTVAELVQLKKTMPYIFQEVRAPHLLFLAGLLHDIGKGHGRDHARRGADLAVAIGRRFGLSDPEVDDLAFLIRYHLYLPDTAMRRDLDDEVFIQRCAAEIKDDKRLAMLYLLTIADARSTGPSAWNDWKAALLQEMYLKIAHILHSSDVIDPDVKQGAIWMREKIAGQLGNETGFDVQSLPTDYLLSFTPEAVVDQIRLLPELAVKEVLLISREQEDHWSLLIMTTDRTGLLASISGVVALHNLRILSAQIFTWPDGTVVDTLEVTSNVDESFSNQDWQAFEDDLRLAVKQRVGIDHRLSRKPRPMGRSAAPAVSRRPAQVLIDNDSSATYTIIEVYADDRLGLLYNITRTLANFGLSIYRAKIGTRADQVVDVFYVLDYDGRKINEKGVQEEIRQELLHVARQAIS